MPLLAEPAAPGGTIDQAATKRVLAAQLEALREALMRQDGARARLTPALEPPPAPVVADAGAPAHPVPLVPEPERPPAPRLRPLSSDERAALRMRYPDDPARRRSCAAIGVSLGMSPDRARRLTTVATAKLVAIVRARRDGHQVAPEMARDLTEFASLARRWWNPADGRQLVDVA